MSSVAARVPVLSTRHAVATVGRLLVLSTRTVLVLSTQYVLTYYCIVAIIYGRTRVYSTLECTSSYSEPPEGNTIQTGIRFCGGPSGFSFLFLCAGLGTFIRVTVPNMDKLIKMYGPPKSRSVNGLDRTCISLLEYCVQMYVLSTVRVPVLSTQYSVRTVLVPVYRVATVRLTGQYEYSTQYSWPINRYCHAVRPY